MGSRFANVIGWVLVALCAFGLLAFIAYPLIYPERCPAWSFYARCALVLFAVSTFAQLRLYNAIVQNTRFAIKLREALIKFSQAFPALERSLKNLNSTMGNVKASSDSLKKELEKNADATDELIKRCQRFDAQRK